VFGLAGITAVIVAGWTTANPTIYRSALSINILFPKFSRKSVTYMIGVLMTILACFPAMTNIGNIVQILGWAVVGVGAICVAEHFFFPKIGYTRHWSMYRGMRVNWAAIIAWAISIAFAALMLKIGALHSNFIFIPEYLIAAVSYIVLAGLMGARRDYSREETEELAFQCELKELVDREAETAVPAETGSQTVITKVFPILAYLALAGMIITAFMTFSGSMGIGTFKTAAFALSVCYFVLNGTATFIKYKRGTKVPN